MTYGEKVSKYRKSRGLSKSVMARSLGISPQLLGQYETDKTTAIYTTGEAGRRAEVFRRLGNSFEKG